MKIKNPLQSKSQPKQKSPLDGLSPERLQELVQLAEANEALKIKQERMAKARAARAVKIAERKAGAEVPGNGHKEEALAAVATALSPSPFKYEGWMPAIVPAKYTYMTPGWLFACIHWEEQAKVARVKASAIGEKLKIGAAIVVLVLFVIVIFLFGVIMMDQGG